MIKYLIRRDNHFWFRRKIKGFREIIFSLKTKDYEVALVRHSYINYKINHLVIQGLEFMTDEELKVITDKYKNYMLGKKVNKFSRQRDEELGVNINGDFFGGHTKEALKVQIDKYLKVHNSNDYDLVKAVTSKILNRSNIKEEFSKIDDEDDLYNFHWELFKTEWDLLYNAHNNQGNIVKQIDTVKEDPKPIQNNIQSLNLISISKLTSKYIEENRSAKDWSDKNERDLKYVLGHLSNYYNDKDINDLNRDDFSKFRDLVIKNLPERANQKILRDKTTQEILNIVKKSNLKVIGITTINKHLRRIHQVFEWASNCGYLNKNLTKDLKIHEKKKSKKKKTSKIPYSQEELKRLFEDSPWFNDVSLETIRYNPEYIFIPLLALYTGAKPTELATLQTSSIIKQNGILGIDFNQMIKTTDSERFTPLSQALIDIGFMKFVKYQKLQHKKMLFTAIRIYKDNGTNFTNKFTIYNRKYITKEKDKSFYSFRHLVNQELKNKEIRSYIINDITGHSHDSNMDDSVYGAGQMPEEILRDTINECLVYDFIDFSKIKESINKVYG